MSGQDPQFTQFYANPLYLAPSFAGVTEQHRFTTSYRNQWPAMGNAFVTYSVSYDYYLDDYNSGVGVLIMRDVSGTGDLGLLNAGLFYSYDININDNLHIRPGIRFNYTQIGIDYYKLIWNDQLTSGDPGGGSIQQPPINTYNPDVDFATSMLIYSNRFWGGLSIDHLLRPNYGLYNNEVLWPIKYTLFSGYKIINKTGYNSTTESLSVVFNFMHQDVFNQLLIGAYWNISPIMLGCWYRGIPLRQGTSLNYDKDPRGDSFAFLIGYKTDNFRIGYSYDFTISQLTPSTGGAHEITFAYEFKDNKKRKKKYKMKPCVDFYF